MLAGCAHVVVGVVLGTWSPTGNYFTGCVQKVVIDVASYKDTRGTETVGYVNKLLEFAVGGVLDFAKPYVSDADIERIVVAEAARDGSFTFHFGLVFLRSSQGQRLSQRAGTLVRCT